MRCALVTMAAAAAPARLAAKEVVIFTTGYDGPIDAGDGWHHFDFDRATTVVSLGGAIPRGLIQKSHAHGVRAVRGDVLDVDVTDPALLSSWVASAVTASVGAGADGVHVVAVRHQPPSATATDVTAALRKLGTALELERGSDRGWLSVSLPFPNASADPLNSGPFDRRAVAELANCVVLHAFDTGLGEAVPRPNIAAAELAEGLVASASHDGVPASKTVVALPWFGWDYRCQPGAPAGTGCTVAPPPATLATWEGWNLRRSVAYIAGVLTGRPATPGSIPTELNSSTMTMQLHYRSHGSAHVVLYDDPTTLSAKYRLCAAARSRGVGVWTADMVNYVGSSNMSRLAAAMWGSLDGFLDADCPTGSCAGPRTRLRPLGRRQAQVGAPSQAARVDRLARRFRAAHQLGPAELIPGYDPCRHRGASAVGRTRQGPGCSNGLLCLSPTANSVAEHESGGCYPARPSMRYVARTVVPPIPPTLRPEQGTVYYYLNLVMPDDGNSDVTNSTKGYGFMNQFVPQLELGEALCGSTGQEGAFQPGACSIVDPLRHWVIQSQYFYGVLNHSGVLDPSGVSWTGYAVTGETVAVFPGEIVITNFTQLSNGTWLLQLSVEQKEPTESAGSVAAAPRKPIRGRGPTMSIVHVDYPYMNPKFSWLDSDFNHTLVGACNEVYNLQQRSTDINRPLKMSITVSDVGQGPKPTGSTQPVRDRPSWMVDWAVNEGLPQCRGGFSNISLATTYSAGPRLGGYTQVAELVAL